MSELWLLVGVSLLPTIAALASYQQGKKNHTVLNQVHTLTNSNLSRVLADLALANDRIAKLEKLIGRVEREDAE